MPISRRLALMSEASFIDEQRRAKYDWDLGAFFDFTERFACVRCLLVRSIFKQGPFATARSANPIVALRPTITKCVRSPSWTLHSSYPASARWHALCRSVAFRSAKVA